jgi:peptidoglycan/LPS O-acetylase OafA/YrhL
VDVFPGYPADHAPFWAAWFIYGRFAVVVFIVLSGFSLALSPALNGWRLDATSRFAQRSNARPIRNLCLSSYSLYLIHAPIVVVVYEKIVAGRVAPGVPAFLVSIVLTLPLSIGLSRLSASVFEIPFLRHRSASWAPRRQHARADGAPA